MSQRDPRGNGLRARGCPSLELLDKLLPILIRGVGYWILNRAGQTCIHSVKFPCSARESFLPCPRMISDVIQGVEFFFLQHACDRIYVVTRSVDVTTEIFVQARSILVTYAA